MHLTGREAIRRIIRRSDLMLLMHGVYMTCMGMCGSCALIGLARLLMAQTHVEPLVGRAEYGVAEVSTERM